MPGGLGPRFVVEAAFLILLAVGTGLADLKPRTIIIVMAVAWALVALIEWLTWRDAARYTEPPGPHAWRPDQLAPRRPDPYAQIVVPPRELVDVEPPPEDLTVIVPPAPEPPRRRLRVWKRAERPPEDGA